MQSCEKIRLSLESCEVEKDISSFIQEKGTGQEIPDPPKYINFCRGELSDSASEASEDDNYSVAQFQRTINPAFRTSSPQPSIFESHHDPKSDLAIRMGHQEEPTPPSREATLTPQKAMRPPPKLDYQRQPQVPSQLQHAKPNDFATVPYNEFPAEGMTMFCRTRPPSEHSSVASPMRPSSRDSQSEYSNPTSFSSQEPPSGKQSPVKPNIGPDSFADSPAKQVQKKRSGFFSNSPFRRKSKSERNGRDLGITPVFATPTSHNTWSSANPQRPGTSSVTPTRPYGRGNLSANSRDKYSGSPEPVDPRANFQLNVGQNVFDVASPDTAQKKRATDALSSPTKELDPIAQALAELKGINKQSSVRMSADRYHGIATPAPPGTPSIPTTSSPHKNPVAAPSMNTPPPSYNDQPPIKRLDPPQPAFTSKQMHEATRKYVGKTQDMYGSSRPGTRGSGSNIPRASSPLPMRSVSPRPAYNVAPSQVQGVFPRSASPNPHVNESRLKQTPNASPTKPGYSSANAGTRYSHHASPNNIQGAVSPKPYAARQERPQSSAGSMALQLADGGSMVSHRGPGGISHRPTSYFNGQPPSSNGEIRDDVAVRSRSKSAADGRHYTRDGRPIIQFGKSLLFPLHMRGKIAIMIGVADGLHFRSESIVPLPCRHSGGIEFRQRRCAGGAPITGRWLVGSRGDGKERTAGPGAQQLFAALSGAIGWRADWYNFQAEFCNIVRGGSARRWIWAIITYVIGEVCLW